MQITKLAPNLVKGETKSRKTCALEIVFKVFELWEKPCQVVCRPNKAVHSFLFLHPDRYFKKPRRLLLLYRMLYAFYEEKPLVH